MLKATQDVYKDHLIIFSAKHYCITQAGAPFTTFVCINHSLILLLESRGNQL